MMEAIIFWGIAYGFAAWILIQREDWKLRGSVLIQKLPLFATLSLLV